MGSGEDFKQSMDSLQEIRRDTAEFFKLVAKSKDLSKQVEQACFLTSLGIAFIRGNTQDGFIQGFLNSALEDTNALTLISVGTVQH